MDFERALAALVVALALDFACGDLPNRFHPVVLMGSLIRTLTRAVLKRGARSFEQFLYGGGIILLGMALFSLPLVFLTGWLRPFFWLDVAVQAVLLKDVFSLRSLLKAGREVARALDGGDLDEARRLTAWHLVSRDTHALEAGHVGSAVVESLTENLTDSFLAPLLAFCLGGLPLAWAYRFVNTADAMIGYRGEPYEYLGKFTAHLDDVLNYLPARLAGLLLCLAALPTGLDMRRALSVMLGQHARTASPNAGWTMSAGAGALGIRLEKIGHYTLGEPGAPLPQTGTVLRRAERLVLAAAGLGGGLCCLTLFLLRG